MAKTEYTVLKRIIFTCFTLTFLLCACQRERHASDVADDRVFVKADTVWYPDGTVATGGFMFMDTPSKKGVRWPYYLLAGGFLASVALFAWFSIRRNRRVRDLQEALEKDRVEIHRLEEELSQSHPSGTEATMAMVRDRVEMVKTLLDKHEALKQRKDLSYMDELESLQETVRNYQQYIDDLRADKAFLGNLEAALDAGKDGIMRKARAVLGDSLSETDALLLSCTYAGMLPSSIGFVTGMQPGAVRTRKSRLKGRIESLPGSEEKDLLLREWL